ncbi:response regulator [Serratia fonticola]|uniref:response regulator n=1 Tax=Serratia fonticola TaxID=47917 RepID=UPI0015BF8F70|nr:response regulator [Serratia fonticola]
MISGRAAPQKSIQDSIREDCMYSVLVIDESTTISVAIKSLLMQSDSFKRVFIAASTQQSLDIMQRHHIDLIITDVELQGDDCFLFLKKVKMEFHKIKFLFFHPKMNPSIRYERLKRRPMDSSAKGKM